MPDTLQPGDFFAISGNDWFGRFQRFMLTRYMDPPSDRNHFGLLWEEHEGDWIVWESIPKGVVCDYLSNYKDERTIQFFRPVCDEAISKEAPEKLVEYGRDLYDFLLIGKMIWDAFAGTLRMLWREHRLRRFRPDEFTYKPNHAMICTEVVLQGYHEAGYDIAPPAWMPFPNVLEWARLQGRVRRLDIDWPRVVQDK